MGTAKFCLKMEMSFVLYSDLYYKIFKIIICLNTLVRPASWVESDWRYLFSLAGPSNLQLHVEACKESADTWQKNNLGLNQWERKTQIFFENQNIFQNLNLSTSVQIVYATLSKLMISSILIFPQLAFI